MPKNLTVSATWHGEETSGVVAVTDESRWIDQEQYLEDCGWEDVEIEETTEQPDWNQDEFDDAFNLNRDD